MSKPCPRARSGPRGSESSPPHLPLLQWASGPLERSSGTRTFPMHELRAWLLHCWLSFASARLTRQPGATGLRLGGDLLYFQESRPCPPAGGVMYPGALERERATGPGVCVSILEGPSAATCVTATNCQAALHSLLCYLPTHMPPKG